jgi:hypothetical protein
MKLWYKPCLIKLTNVTAFTALINDITKRIQTFPVYFVIYTQIPTRMFTHIYGFKLLSINLHLNTFTAKDDYSRFKYSCVRLPKMTIIDLIFQPHSFSLKSADMSL